jgi:SET domain-containing protein
MVSTSLPHEGVYVRMGPSEIHGIGVFAGQEIAKGTNVFETDQRAIRWIPESALAELPLSAFQRRFYEDFAIRRDGCFGCPEDFNHLSVGWYVNEPAPGETPNLEATEDFQLVAARDIAEGEELTVSYASFSDAPSKPVEDSA